MSLRLKENPREWQKFTASVAVMISIVAWLLNRKGGLPVPVWTIWLGAGSLVLTSLVMPRGFRGFYRVGMSVGFFIGQAVGKVLLVLFFLALVIPLGLVLRLMGKDLLALKRPRNASTYWTKPRQISDFDRQF
jgi:hypothetical protein